MWPVLCLGLLLALGAQAASADEARWAPRASRALDELRGAGVEVQAVRAPVGAQSEADAVFARVLRFGGDGLRVDLPEAKAATTGQARTQAVALASAPAWRNAFGLTDASELVARSTSKIDAAGMRHVRLRQEIGGVPVTGSELIVVLDGDAVRSVRGKVLVDDAWISSASESVLRPKRSPKRIQVQARELLEKHLARTDFALSTPRLEILHRGLLEQRKSPTHLAWYVEATAIDLRERLWLDDASGARLLQFSQLTDAKNRQVHDTGSSAVLPGALVRSEGGPVSGNTDVDLAYDFSGDTYDYFFDEHGRDSYDDAGAALISTVDYCPSPAAKDCPFLNAFWNGSQMVYGDGFSAADDVDAHELSHAVIEYTADLFYYMQSGALNESYADIFGETVDLTNGAGTDSGAVRWQMGEDLPSIGAIRNMATPNDFGDPNRMSDAANFYCLDPGTDAGGVHVNSGVQNHAYALLVDGGSFNGQSVAGIGLAKAGKIVYRALSTYLSQASDFFDADQGWISACDDLVGIDGITANDCSQVTKALDAVEMADIWPCNPTVQQDADLCGANQYPDTYFFDDLESGGGNWGVQALTGVSGWFLGNTFAYSGGTHLLGANFSTTNDSAVFMFTPVTLPSGAFLHFHHSFGFENTGASFWDGGVIEYSTNSGGTWFDAGGLIDSGVGYVGNLQSGNPMGVRPAFASDSYGYASSRLDLSSLAGQDVQFRFRIGTDFIGNDYGWFIDDVRIYDCTGIFADGFESGDVTRWSSSTP